MGSSKSKLKPINHSDDDTRIKNASDMCDIECLSQWITKRQESALLKCLDEFEAQHICAVIVSFLSADPEASERVTQQREVYRAFFHRDLFSLNNGGNPPCDIWMQSLPTIDNDDEHDTAIMHSPFRVVLMGDSAVGKTPLSWRLIDNAFSHEWGMHCTQRTSIYLYMCV